MWAPVVDAKQLGRLAHDRGVHRNVEELVEHARKRAQLLGIAVGVDDDVLDSCLELRVGPRHALILPDQSVSIGDARPCRIGLS